MISEFNSLALVSLILLVASRLARQALTLSCAGWQIATYLNKTSDGQWRFSGPHSDKKQNTGRLHV